MNAQPPLGGPPFPTAGPPSMPGGLGGAPGDGGGNQGGFSSGGFSGVPVPPPLPQAHDRGAFDADIGNARTDLRQDLPQPSDVEEPGLDKPVKTPVIWLVLSAGLVLVSVAVSLFALSSGRGASLGVVAWLIGGPLAIGAMAMFFTTDSKARQNPWYAGAGGGALARRLVIGSALLAVTMAAYLVANDVARGRWS